MKHFNLFLIFTAVSLSSMNAAILFDNGPTDNQNAFHSDFDNSQGTNIGQLANQFTLASDSVLTSIQWSGIYGKTDTTLATVDHFTLRIFNVVNGVPSVGATLSFNLGNNVNRVDTGTTTKGIETFSYSATLPNVSLSAGTYFLSIVNQTNNTTSDWYWATSNASSGTAMDRSGDGASWQTSTPPNDPNGFDNAFTLNGNVSAVPEPSVTVMCGVGLVLLVAAQRFRASRN